MVEGFDATMPAAFHRLGVAGARAAVTALRPTDGEPVEEVLDRTVEGRHGPIAVRIYRPVDATGASIVYLHGGGWTMGSIDGCDAVCRRLANSTLSTVISVEYRLAPEHKYPVPLDDCYDVVVWWVAQQGSGAPIAVAGDSAGANLAMALCLRARNYNGPRIAAQLLAYPVFGDPRRYESYIEYADGPILSSADIDWFLRNYINEDSDLDNEEVLPSRARTLRGLPPAIVVTAAVDPLRGSAEAAVAALDEAGVRAQLLRVEGTVHSFFTEVGTLRSADRAVDAVAEFAREIFAG